jgi:hypothetical protein
MDVARPLPNGLEQDRIHQSDDRSFVGCVQQVLRLVELMGQLIETLTGRDVLHHVFRAGRTGGLVVGAVEACEQGDPGRQHGLDGLTEQ